MLEELRIRGLGVIEDAELPLAPGLTVLTGETGADKTMVVTGLGLLLGGRAEPGLVGAGRSSAVVEGRAVVDPEGPVAARAAEAGAELDGGALLLTRTLSSEGRSRAHLGGRSVPAALLAELGAELVAVHGQSDQVRLLRPARQRAALDASGGSPLLDARDRYAAAFARLRQVEAGLRQLLDRARERRHERDGLRHGLAQVEAVAPQPGEDAALAAEEERLAHADALRAAAGTARDALAADDPGPGSDALTALAAARTALDRARGHDPALADLADRVAEATYLVADVAADLSSYAEGVEVDPLRLAAVAERRAALTALVRSHGRDVADVLRWAEEAHARLLELEGDDDRVERLAAERDRLRGELSERASELGQLRRAAAMRLAAAVTAELAGLALPHARLEVAVDRTPDPNGLEVDGELVAAGPDGVEAVELRLAPHAGSDPRPLARGASGGELSRVMLALEVVLAGTSPRPTLVFDEVDAGVGGRAAVQVGRRLAALARDAQVLVVTHLPQVAAFADTHLQVRKAEDGSVVRSGVVVLDEAGRERELSRMLAGLEGSRTAVLHARELRAAAAADRGG